VYRVFPRLAGFSDVTKSERTVPLPPRSRSRPGESSSAPRSAIASERPNRKSQLLPAPSRSARAPSLSPQRFLGSVFRAGDSFFDVLPPFALSLAARRTGKIIANPATSAEREASGATRMFSAALPPKQRANAYAYASYDRATVSTAPRRMKRRTSSAPCVAVETGDASPIHGVAEMGFADYPAISGRQASASAA